MTNREWLQNMAMIDMLTLFNRSSKMCIFELLGISNLSDRCDKFDDEEKSIDDCCYDCLCSWLNENFQKNFQKPLDKVKMI